MNHRFPHKLLGIHATGLLPASTDYFTGKNPNYFHLESSWVSCTLTLNHWLHYCSVIELKERGMTGSRKASDSPKDTVMWLPICVCTFVCNVCMHRYVHTGLFYIISCFLIFYNFNYLRYLSISVFINLVPHFPQLPSIPLYVSSIPLPLIETEGVCYLFPLQTML